ncbi:GNAT family N-acetyltransferase [Chitinophaga polysaccharea]|uniref:GNAT family N-acetyltransferase n=1 Tax=Chitinophaga TaxID=79328 RepID=UPI001455BC01|nr:MULTISPECIES: GNAT family N-acetyltransferase [Chitinophaga]NLR56789.1 GNAT family N-acetyltransferase [Chitinophaga polysaccharea]NLU93015.1 GNAT family N-acetyltransferase [Chitinophaga sp. Ak27]
MITIQPIQIREHYALINSMMEQLHISEKEFFLKTAAWESIAADYMQHVIDTQETCEGTCLVAYVDNTPAGFIFAYLEETDESRIEDYTNDTLYVSDGYVDKAFRRQGIYRLMNEELENIYIAKGIRRIVRYTLTNNHRMQRFLDTQHYTPVRLVYEKWLTDDGKNTLPLFPEQKA